jgi:hypothetical protein
MASAQILNSGKAMYAWNGTNWIPINAQNQVVNSTRWQKIATNGQTTLSGLDDNGNSLIYSPGFEQVFLNGILLVRGTDYTATNGTSITGLDPISAGANIEVIALKQINLANVYNKDQVDSMIDNIDLTPYLTLSTASTTYLTQSSASVNYEPNIPYVSGSPSTPAAGTLWIDSTNNLKPALKVYNGSNWIAVSGAASESGFHPFFGAY